MKIASIGPAATLSVLEWKEWGYQLISALISGGAGAIASAGISPMIDPQHFNPSTAAYWKLILGMFFGTGIIKACVYLQTHPLPQVRTTTTVQTVEKTPPVTTITTVQKTEVASPPTTPKET